MTINTTLDIIEKITEKLSGYFYKVSHITAAIVPELPNMFLN